MRPRFTVAGIGHLKNLKNLKTVDFAQIWSGPQGADQGDEVVRQLATLPNLESIKGLNYLSAEGMKKKIAFGRDVAQAQRQTLFCAVNMKDAHDDPFPFLDYTPWV